MTAQSSSDTAPQVDPETRFSTPGNIVSDTGIDPDQKRKALDAWRCDLEDRLRATFEGMTPVAGRTAAEAALLAQVRAAERAMTGI